jgi:prepilin-type N-terminal cleavage/methylation domain-containing protein
MGSKKAFTLIEVLISIVLVGLILPPLYKLITLMYDSNSQIYTYVKKQSKESKIINIMYLDLLSSDGNISIQKDDFSRVCINSTNNSLYGHPKSKVCWVVIKENNTLVRVEGKDYRLPLDLEDNVEVYNSFKNLELFDVYKNKSDVLVVLKQRKQKPIAFNIYGITATKNKHRQNSKKHKVIKSDTNNSIKGGELF